MIQTTSLLVRPRAVRSRLAVDRVVTGLVVLSAVVALVPLLLIVGVTVVRGLPAMNLEFLTETFNFSRRTAGGGYLHGLIGSLYMGALAALMAIPIGIAAGVFLTEFPRSRLAGPLRFFSDVMTGVPSVFVGLFVYTLLVSRIGFGTFVGAVSLAIIMLPIVVRASEEILRLVPGDLKRASYALGARQWQTVLRVVLPTAAPGLVTGSVLAIARALGETAPLVLTALAAQTVVLDFQGGGQTALPLLIFREARGAFAAGQERAWAGALELMLLVLVLSVIARYVGRRFHG
ncbi:MAG TPA: phosphate ABC transporter permease PstA [Candidatus Limnocylindria bacterium]|nr:phosphate ABC transporter permease PstA [Candidatus Limnocylindria bacterium]